MIIHKQTLILSRFQDLTLPIGAKILKLDLQGREITMWYLCDARNVILDTETVRFQIVGTGHDEIPEHGVQYVGTVQQDGFVWHVFMWRSY